MRKDDIKINRTNASLVIKLKPALTKKIILNSNIEIVIFLENNINTTITGITVIPGNLIITHIFEERETSKAIEEIKTFTLKTFSEESQKLKVNHRFSIHALFEANQLGIQPLTLKIKYRDLNPLTYDMEDIIVNIEDLPGGKVEVISREIER